MSEMLVAIKGKIAQAEGVFKSVSEEFNQEKAVLEKQLAREKEMVTLYRSQENRVKEDCKKKIETAKSGIVTELNEMKNIHKVTLKEKEELSKIVANSGKELQSIQAKLKSLQKEYADKASKVNRENTELKKELSTVKTERT